jgi:hypothetical protein
MMLFKCFLILTEHVGWFVVDTVDTYLSDSKLCYKNKRKSGIYLGFESLLVVRI